MSPVLSFRLAEARISAVVSHDGCCAGERGRWRAKTQQPGRCPSVPAGEQMRAPTGSGTPEARTCVGSKTVPPVGGGSSSRSRVLSFMLPRSTHSMNTPPATRQRHGATRATIAETGRRLVYRRHSLRRCRNHRLEHCAGADVHAVHGRPAPQYGRAAAQVRTAALVRRDAVERDACYRGDLPTGKDFVVAADGGGHADRQRGLRDGCARPARTSAACTRLYATKPHRQAEIVPGGARR